MKFHGIVVWRLMGSGQDGVSLCHGLEAAGVWMDGYSVCMACGLSESRMNAVSLELWYESKLVQTQERVAFCCKHAIFLFGCNLGIPIHHQARSGVFLSLDGWSLSVYGLGSQ